jgi:hypothetical protein
MALPAGIAQIRVAEPPGVPARKQTDRFGFGHCTYPSRQLHDYLFVV